MPKALLFCVAHSKAFSFENQLKLHSSFLILFLISSTSVNAVPTSENGESQLYPNSISNSEISFSINKFTYKEGDIIDVFGIVTNYKSGARVYINSFDPNEEMTSQVDISPINSGEFTVPLDILREIISGQYRLEAQYGKEGQIVKINFSVDGPNNDTVSILPRSSVQDLQIHFEPQHVTVEAGKPISWINKDSVVHTITSGKSVTGQKMFSDGAFASGIIVPSETFEISLNQGNYTYFCSLHPWFLGSITVTPSTSIQQEPGQTQQPEEESVEYTMVSDAEDTNSWTLTTCDNCTSSINSSRDKKQGSASTELSVHGSKKSSGPRTTFNLNFVPIDFLLFKSLSIWIKTTGNAQDDSVIGLIDSNGKFGILSYFNSDSFPLWHEWNLPIKFLDSEEGFNPNSITVLSIRSPEGESLKEKQLVVLLDDIKLKKLSEARLAKGTQPYLTIKTDRDTYTVSEAVIVYGDIKLREADLPVTFQVLAPNQNLVLINQVVPNPNNSYNFTIPLSGPQFTTMGLYKITTQYGVQKYKAETYFTLLSLLPPPPFAIADEVLLQIWNERTDLQAQFPEAAQGNLENLKTWARNIGWNEDQRLSALIPEGQTPAYGIKPKDDNTITLLIILGIIGLAVAIIIITRVFNSSSRA
jgi:plastocyanin